MFKYFRSHQYDRHCLNPKHLYKNFHLENLTEPVFALWPIEVWLAWLIVSLCRTCDIGWWKFRSEGLHYLWQCRPIRLLTVWTYDNGECCWLGFHSSSRSFHPGQHWFILIFLSSFSILVIFTHQSPPQSDIFHCCPSKKKVLLPNIQWLDGDEPHISLQRLDSVTFYQDGQQCPGRTNTQGNGGRLVLWKVRLNWESGGCETGALTNKKRISTGNHFEEEDFYPDELWNRWISSGLIHWGSDIIWF